MPGISSRPAGRLSRFRIKLAQEGVFCCKCCSATARIKLTGWNKMEEMQGLTAECARARVTSARRACPRAMWWIVRCPRVREQRRVRWQEHSASRDLSPWRLDERRWLEEEKSVEGLRELQKPCQFRRTLGIGAEKPTVRGHIRWRGIEHTVERNGYGHPTLFTETSSFVAWWICNGYVNSDSQGSVGVATTNASRACDEPAQLAGGSIPG
ncbi:hypothetical protein B0H10DRAFT_2392839 [Mycena sp. CBHHK59/15]|nr:hypothetical protein B0H10DRAFT_2392839 [Mycena sp. CBHHK59/15]